MAVVVGGAGLHGTWGSEPGASVFEIAGNAAFVDALLWGTFTMVAVALVMGVGSGIANLDEAMETVIDGFSMMLTALTILVMAWTIGSVTTALGTGIYVTNIAENFVTPTLLPVVVLVASAFIAFSTGTSWGTMAIVTPIAVPLAWSVGGATPALLPVAIGTVFSGAIFGDHCSPISDTTILSSTFTGADHIDHVRTQMYYATTVLVVAASLLTVWGATRITPLVLLPVGVVMLGGLVYVLSSSSSTRTGRTWRRPARFESETGRPPTTTEPAVDPSVRQTVDEVVRPKRGGPPRCGPAFSRTRTWTTDRFITAFGGLTDSKTS